MALSHEHTVVADALDEATVLGDADYLKELLLVLVDNAIQYTPDGGEIHLAVRHEGDLVAIDVRDNGLGIAAHEIPHLFERFYRADNARHRATGTSGGTGLGLAIARWIAEEHGGRIDVVSAPGAGSTFTLRLPAQAAPVAAVPEEPVAAR